MTQDEFQQFWLLFIHEIVAEQRSRFGTVESLQTANSSNNVADDSNATIDYYKYNAKICS
jgi:hypothetical protein